ncbi:aminotransferase class III-fold pyridoxal phosphate-dependent enzyme [Sphingomonas sp. CL5.1]|uniref:aminotransferase class III-fold pyridoxal phosphate-dependent enzyme n=1 Tax=Sphingomonas sp. CL5.1 TaxID=2653203 RepID=UPI001583899A|nr:aminotransferase class III-fold pyridoxal phosphate-dependent enzyme [Sphingomonas sp. CL5.1]QKR99878.1 aminotransferase class III-fold pyridoxal phosphate-dependent enzyme [Sphingomonas sp. CL5.1]
MAWANIKARALRERAQRVIPNGMYGHESTRLLPDEFPQFFHRGEGARMWDADGNSYIDYICAFGPNLFGYGHASIDEAAAAQQRLGDTLTGPSEIMVDLAEAFVGQVSHADWAMFCKNGSDATTMAMVVARAHRGRKTILCAKGTYHGTAPWCTPRLAGILPEDRAHIVYYTYNDPDSLADAFAKHAGDVAGVFATAFRHEVFYDQQEPTLEYASTARRLCDEHDALLIVDDVRAGFRMARDCSWEPIGVRPDLSTWGKCIANGHPISALLGSDKARDAACAIFATGSFWFSAAPMAAAIETLKQIRETDYLERINQMGQRLRDGLQQQAGAHGFGLRQTGPVVMPQLLFEDDADFRVGYGWVTECLKRGAYIHPYHNLFLSAAHSEADINATLEITDQAFEALKARRDRLEPHPILMQLLAG